MVVSLSVITNHRVPPELVGEEGAANCVSIVDLVIVADPGADQSPHSFPGRVSSEARDSCGFATY